MSEPNVVFDEILDPAFAEIYYMTICMEKEGKCEADMDAESLAVECKKLAAEFVESYNEACKHDEVSYYDMLSDFADERIPERFPVSHKYEVLLSYIVQKKITTYAASEADARIKAEKVKLLPTDIGRYVEVYTPVVSHIAKYADDK